MKKLTFRGYARHRGCSVEAVSKAVKQGRISVVEEDGKRWIDPVQADKQWALNTDSAKKIGGDARAAKGSAPKDPEPDEPKQSGPSYHQSRAIREAYMARLAKLDYEERAAKLVSADKVKVEYFRLFRVTRDAVLSIPDRIAAEVAALSDPQAVHAMLAVELRRALEELTARATA